MPRCAGEFQSRSGWRVALWSGKNGLPPRPPVNDTAVSTMTFAYVEAGTSALPVILIVVRRSPKRVFARRPGLQQDKIMPSRPKCAAIFTRISQ